jgi:hypothetical protein
MGIYTTIDGRQLDLSALNAEERAAFASAWAAYGEEAEFTAFNNTFVTGPANPLLRDTGGWVTEAVWHHPLYRALSDLGARLGIAQGRLAPEGDWRSDPLAGGRPPVSEAMRRSS